MQSNEYYSLAQYGESLCHHGIKGQAWGVTNGPPYPLGREGKARHGWFRAKKEQFLKNMSERAQDKTKAKTINRQIMRANTANLKVKAKEESAKNEVRKARHAWKDANRRERMKIKAEQQKLKDEERRRHDQMKAERAKLKAEKSRANAERNQSQLNQLRAMTSALPKVNVKTPRQALVERVINSGDKKMLKKYGNLLSNDEYKAATDRIKMNMDLKNAGKLARLERVKDFVSAGSKIVGDLKTDVEGVATIYNNINAAAKIFAPNSKFAKKAQIRLPDGKSPTAKTISDKLKDMTDRAEYRRRVGKDPITGKVVKQKYDPKAWVPDYSKGPILNSKNEIVYDNNGVPKYPMKQGGMRDYYYWEDE